MNMLFSLLILINFSILYSYSIVSQILPFVSILEESPISTIVVDLRPIFQTLYVNPNQAALLHSQSSQPFEYINGYIRLKSRLDREDYVRKRLCIGGNVLECNFTLTLTVNLDEAPYNYILSQPISCHDINDMIPKFSQSEAKIFMAENVPIGHRIPLEIAIDLDSLPYGIDYYRLETIDDSEQHQFSIVYDNQSRELELIVKEKLDRELIEKYLFKLIAIDRGHPPNVGAQILTIEIVDVNDCRPRFESPVYNVTIAENTVPEYLLKIHAVDNDIGSNAELIYTLENDYDKLFRLDKQTGILTLNQALDYELHKLYQLNVQVHDNGVNPLGNTCIIYVYVLDQNDHAPSIQMKFNPIFEHNQDGNMAYVKESFDINLPLAFVTVFDQDSEDRGKAQLTVEPHRLFYHELIRPNYYAIKAHQNFDRESVSSYQIELHARDFGQPSLRRSMTFELNITDINDQIPQFHTNYTFDLIENNRIPTIIGQIHAYDNDQGLNGQITYAIIPESSYFFITANDGTISTNTSFNYEIKRKYKFQVRARDHGQPPLESFIDVQINIININEFSPTFEQDNYEFFVYENKTIQFIGQVKAYDLDFNDSISYVLRNYEDLFRVDSNGKIFTHVVFDRELQEEYKLTVIATDNSTIGSTIVTIKILDVNDNPPIFIWPESDEIQHILSHDHSERIDINNPNAQFITDITMYDDDIGNNSLIDLTISDNNELFYVGPNNSLWLRNSSIQPGIFYIELQAKNFEFETKKFLQIIINEENSLKLNLFNNMNKNFHRFSMIITTIVTFFIMSFTIFLIIYYFCIRKNVEKKLYGSRLIVNDEDKSKQNSPQTKSTTVILPSSHNSDYTIITKQRKNSQVPSGHSPSTTDVEFSSSMRSCPFNGISSSSTSHLDRPHSRHHNPHSSAISALTTLTRKSTRRQQTKNVSFQRSTTNHMFNDLFQNTSSTFSTLPKQTKYDASLNENAPVLTDLPRSQSNNFPTLQTMLDQSVKDGQTQLPQPPPLLNGILLLDKMLKNSSMPNDDKRHTISTSSGTNNGWYNVTSNYQTRASIV